MTQYGIFFTQLGRDKIAAATAAEPLEITHIAVGDGGGGYPAIDDTITSLVNELGRYPVAGVSIPAPTQRQLSATIDTNIGPAVIRERGLIDSDGDLIAIAQSEPIEIPATGGASVLDLSVSIIATFNNTEHVRAVVNVQSYVRSSRKIIAGTALEGGGDLTTDPVISAKIATKEEAEEGESEDVLMTPKRTKDALLKLHSSPVILDEVTYGVGVAGDFETINEALVFLSNKYPSYYRGGIKIEVKLLSGFVMKEQVAVVGVDMGWVTITSEDEEVVIDNTYLVDDSVIEGIFPAFLALRGVLPTIGVLFNMDGEKVDERKHGIEVRERSRAVILEGCGIKNANGRGLDAQQASTVDAKGAVFSGAAENGIGAYQCSIINAKEADIRNAGLNGVYCHTGSQINVHGGDVSGAGLHGVACVNGSSVNAVSVTADNVGGSGIYASYNSTINASRSIVEGAGISCAFAANCSTINVYKSVLSGSSSHTINARNGSTVNAEIAVMEEGASNFLIKNGSFINAHGTNVDLPPEKNTLTSDGAIFG